MFEKVEVNGPDFGTRSTTKLTAVPDASGDAGDIQWNFEKFVLGPDGSVVARFRPRTVPDDPAVLAAIESSLPRWRPRLGRCEPPGSGCPGVTAALLARARGHSGWHLRWRAASGAGTR